MHPNADIYITQGFICRNAYGEIDNLQRGGSDYTASLIGAAVNASEIQIWTDIDGMHDNDPRIVDKTSPVRPLHFEEAAELAYFGAKILHPTCVQPAKYANIPVRLLNTMEPTAPGTLISNDTEKGKIKAVAAKDNITAIKIKSSRMLLAHGFLRKGFEIFESYQTSIDMICTSEVGVSVSIDNTKHLNEILDDLKKYGVTTIDYMIASHPHSDHIGGLVDVLEDAAVSSDLTVSMVLLPEVPDKDVPTTRVYEAFLDGIEDNHIDPTFVSEKQTLNLGGSTTLELIAPPAGKTYSSLNDYSMAAYLNCGGKTFLFTGDAEKNEEADWLENGVFDGMHADVFKAGHHGSRTSSSEALLEQIQPTYAVISCGTDNSYGHPHEEALDRLDVYCDKVYRTDLDGTVICKVEDGELKWSFDKEYAS